MITRNTSPQLKNRTHVAQAVLVSCNPWLEKVRYSLERVPSQRKDRRQEVGDSDRHWLHRLDVQKSCPVSESVRLEFSCGKRSKRRYVPDSLPSPRPASLASASSSLHRSRRVWLPPPDTPSGPRPAMPRTIVLTCDLRRGAT